MSYNELIKKTKDIPYNLNEKLQKQNTQVEENKSNIEKLDNKMNEVFQSVSNGKELIASAITDKGIPTSSDDTFETMANNIKDIIDIDMVTPSWSVNIGTVTATCNTISGIFKEFRVNNGEWQSSNIFSGLTGNTQYTFEGKNLGGGTSSVISTSPKANQTVPSIPVASNIDIKSITITADSGCKIRYNNNLYTSPYTFTELTADTEYLFYSVKEATANLNESVSTVLKVRTKSDIIIYGVDIDETNSDSSTCVTYTDSAVGFTPLYCGNGTLNYGSWSDTFVIQGNKPCLLKDGIRQYYLNPNDYSKKEDGSSSVIIGDDGDVMAEFKKCYYKLWKEGNIVKFRVANGKPDDTWCCNAFLSEDGQGIEKDYMYIGTYQSCTSSSKMRSLHNRSAWASHNITTARTQATANGSGYQQLTLSKWVFVSMLTVLVTKSLNHQLTIGQGRSKSTNTSVLSSGTMNTKGQFWGDQTGTNGMKIFHIENWYGNIGSFVDGLIISSRVSKYKINGPYNDTWSDYSTGYNIASGDGYITKINCDNNNGIVPSTTGGSSTTYYCDYLFMSSSNHILVIGGRYDISTSNGTFYMRMNNTSTTSNSTTGSRLTYS